MKLPESNIVIEGSSSLKSFSFSIDQENQGLIMEMFHRKIYEDPIGSIIREIGSNARDANRENNKSDVPIEFIFNYENKLSNNSNLTLEIKDSGIGISPDRMENVFIKYTNSTKTDSNEFTGGFGIGAKTPFAYKDIFNIITINNGVKYYYVSYIDETKKGKVDLQYTEETDENSGTSIIIPIDKKDENLFNNAISFYTSFWNIKPIVISNIFNNSQIELIHDSELFSIYYDNNNVYSNIYTLILIDDIPYTIQPNKKIEYTKNISSNFKLCLKFKNADLDISLNRETLQYNDNTIDKINERLLYIKTTFDDLLTLNLIINNKTYLDACIQYSKIYNYNKINNGYLYYAFYWIRNNTVINYRYNNIELVSKFTFSIYEFIFVDYRLGDIEYSISDTLQVNDIIHNQFYNITRLNKNKTEYLYNDNENFILVRTKSYEKYRTRHYIYDPKDFDSILLKEKEILNSLNITLIDYDSIIVPKNKIKKVEKKDYNTLKYKSINSDNHLTGTGLSASKFILYKEDNKLINTQHHIIYYLVDSIVNYNISTYNYYIFKYYKEFYDRTNNSILEVKFIAVNKNNIKTLLKLENAYSFDYIKEIIEPKLKGINKLLYFSDINNYLKRNNLKKLKYNKKVIDLKIEKINKKLNKLSKTNNNLYRLLKDTPVNVFGNIKNDNKSLNKIGVYIYNIGEKYPLLKYINSNSFYSNIDSINEYIKLFNNKHLIK